MTEEEAKRTNYVSVVMTGAEQEAVDAWRTAKRPIQTRAAAMRDLIALGLAAHAAGWSPEAPKPKKPKKGA